MSSQKKPTAKQRIEYLEKQLDYEMKRTRLATPMSIDEFNWVCETLATIKEGILNPPIKIEQDEPETT